jgi:hypothetical protein
MAYISPYSYVSGINNEPLLKVDFESKQKVIDKKQEDFDDAYRNIAKLSTPILFANMYNEKAQQVAESYNTEFNSYFDINNNYDYSDPKLLNNIKNKLTQFTQDPILKNDFNFQKKKEDISKSIQESVKNKTYNPESAFIINYEDEIYKKSSDPLSTKSLSEYVPTVDVTGQLKDLNCDDDWDIRMGQERLFDKNPDGSYKTDVNGNLIIIEEVLNDYTRKSRSKEKLKSCYETVIGNNSAYFNTKAKYNKIINQNNPLYQQNIVKAYQTFNNNEIERLNEGIQAQEKLLKNPTITIDQKNNINNYLKLAKDKIDYLQKNNETANFEDIHDYTFYNIQSENYAFGKAREQIIDKLTKNIQYEILQNEKYKNIEMSLKQAQIKELEAKTMKIKAEISNIVSENNQFQNNDLPIPNSNIAVSPEKTKLDANTILQDLKSNKDIALKEFGVPLENVLPIYDKLKALKQPILKKEDERNAEKITAYKNEYNSYEKNLKSLKLELEAELKKTNNNNTTADELISKLDNYKTSEIAYDYFNNEIQERHIKNMVSFIKDLSDNDRKKTIMINVGNSQFKEIPLVQLTEDQIKDNYNVITESFKNFYKDDYSKGNIGQLASKIKDGVVNEALIKLQTSTILPSSIIDHFINAGEFIWNKGGEYNSRIPNLSNDIKKLNNDLKGKSDNDKKNLINNFNRNHPDFQFSDDYGSKQYYNVTGIIGEQFEKWRKDSYSETKGKSFYELSLPSNEIKEVELTAKILPFRKGKNGYPKDVVAALSKIGIDQNWIVNDYIEFDRTSNSFIFTPNLSKNDIKDKKITVGTNGEVKTLEELKKNDGSISVKLRDNDFNYNFINSDPIFNLFLLKGGLGSLDKPIFINNDDGTKTKAIVKNVSPGIWTIIHKKEVDNIEEPWEEKKGNNGQTINYSADEIFNAIKERTITFK